MILSVLVVEPMGVEAFHWDDSLKIARFLQKAPELRWRISATRHATAASNNSDWFHFVVVLNK